MVEEWKMLSDAIIRKFVEVYFDGLCHYYWINDDYQIFNVSDYYFNFSDARYCLENEVEVNKLFEWYDFSLETSGEGGRVLSLGDYLIAPEERKLIEEEYLIELRNRVENAKQALENAIINQNDRLTV